ncbi:MAG: sigma-70 family RNA polymerase sigma factor [Erysipelotrichales bacterium]|nr:sigma-70 family RNA polymerase sigma factor [Erysipelotrichales bacterium]
MERYNEEELLYLMHCGSETALECLIEIYYEKIRRWIWSFQFHDYIGLELEDFIQIGMICFLSAIEGYRSDKKTSLSTYVKSAILRRMSSKVALTKDKRIYKEHQLISLDDSIKESEGMRYDEVIEDTSIVYHPQKIFEVREATKEYLYEMSYKASPSEKLVMGYLLEGYNAKEISNILQVPIKSVYNTSYRLHKKSRH